MASLVFSVSLIVAGLVPVAYFLALAAGQLTLSIQGGKWIALPVTLAFSDHALLATGKAAPLLSFIPQFPWIATPTVTPFLDKVHIALVPALLGLALVTLGVLRILRHKALVRAIQQREDDRIRRMEDYRRDGGDFIDGRREPFISSRRAA
jgi:hypothetical protein